MISGCRPPKPLFFLAVLLVAVILCASVLPAAFADGDVDLVELSPARPTSDQDVYVNFTMGFDSPALFVVRDMDSSDVVLEQWANFVGGNASLGPLNLPPGNYSVNATYWVVVNGSLEPGFFETSFRVFSSDDDGEEYGAMGVVITGITIVFFTLGLLTLSTILTGRVLKNRVSSGTAGGGAVAVQGDDMERIAAIAAAIRIRGE